MKISEREGMTPIDRMCLKAGISRRELAARSGVPYITLDQWARRVRKPRDVYQLRKVARALGCHIENLLEDDPEPNKG